jgi:hypothetical protein
LVVLALTDTSGSTSTGTLGTLLLDPTPILTVVVVVGLTVVVVVGLGVVVVEVVGLGVVMVVVVVVGALVTGNSMVGGVTGACGLFCLSG